MGLEFLNSSFPEPDGELVILGADVIEELVVL
jgi:hypothetical protein